MRAIRALQLTMLFPWAFDKSKRSRPIVRSWIPWMSFLFTSRASISNISTLLSGVTHFFHVSGLRATAPCPAKYMMIGLSRRILGSFSSFLKCSMMADLVAHPLRRLRILSSGTPTSLRKQLLKSSASPTVPLNFSLVL